jgi:hypothetical protein
MQVEAELYDKTVIDVNGIKEFLDKLNYPQYFLDFETFMPAIPKFDGTRPYQPVPFQYSLHVLENGRQILNITNIWQMRILIRVKRLPGI